MRVGSITKVFCGAALASMVARLCWGVTIPQRDGKEIRLIDLATHSSGLPYLAVAAHHGLAIADHADDEARHFGFEKDDGPGEIDGFGEELGLGARPRRPQ